MNTKFLKTVFFLVVFFYFDLAIGKVIIDKSDNDSSKMCGTNCNWILYDDGKLEISGSGDMNEFEDIYDENDMAIGITTAPWSEYINSITTVIVNNGITRVGSKAFAYANNLTDVQLDSESISTIGGSAFFGTKNLKHIIIPSSVEGLEEELFENSGIEELTIEGNPALGSIMFDGCDQQITINYKNDDIYELCEEIYPDYDLNFLKYIYNDDGSIDYYKPNGTNENGEQIYSLVKSTNTNGITNLYNNGKITTRLDKNGNIIKRTFYTIKEANEDTPNSKGKYSIRLSF